jgi:hypothetical protein
MATDTRTRPRRRRKRWQGTRSVPTIFNVNNGLGECWGHLLFLFLAAVPVFAAWAVWSARKPIWTTPKWKTFATMTSLVAVTLAFVISIWMITAHQGKELYYGTLMRMQPWPRIAAYSGLVSIPAALIGKKGTRMLVVPAAVLIELSNFAAVLTD